MPAYKHILVPVDFSPVSQRIINRGKELADLYQSKLTLLYVLQDIPPIQSFGDMPMVVDMQQQTVLLEQSKTQLVELAKNVQVPDGTKLEVQEGLPADAISLYAADNNIDLIIVGHSAKKGLLGFIMGSTAASVAKNAKCDVLVMQVPKTA